MTGEETVFDVCVVGAGLVGLGVALALSDEFDGISLLVLDKEEEVAAHQSSHNSGVVHSGLYYKPGSLKAKLCVQGRRAIYELASEAGVPFNQSGKVVIATETSDLAALDELERRGNANGLKGLRRLGAEEIKEVEPEAAGLGALYVPEAGVVDFAGIARHHVDVLETRGTSIIKGVEVSAIDPHGDSVIVRTGDRRFRSKTLVNCAGLQSDLVAMMAGVSPAVRIVPFRGEYYQLADEAAELVRSLIYPVPDPRFPFLGVHLTRRVDGTVEVGPNAVLALGREHYRGSSADWSELRSILAYPGFRKLASRHLLAGAKEMLNSKSTGLYARLARRLVPALERGHLLPGGAGVRAQAVDAAGNLVDDFVIETAGPTVHVLNAPSPGATASLAIGRHIAAQMRPLIRG